MGRIVDGSDNRTNSPVGHTKISEEHQVTIPSSAFRTAGLEVGDTLRVETQGAGKVVLTRVDELIDRYSNCLDTKSDLQTQRDKSSSE